MADFNDMSWHDNLIYGLHFQCAEPDRNIWRSNLVLDIDHIIEWVKGPQGQMNFRVAPATLIFHDVRDFSAQISHKTDGREYSLSELSVGNISREPLNPVPKPMVLEYKWIIELNSPNGGQIKFKGIGFSQVLREPPQLVEQQHLRASTRAVFVLPE